MRQFSNDIITKSEQTNQTIAAESEPYVSLRISRKRTILDNMDLAEKVKVRKLSVNAITDGDVAVCHPRFKGENTKIWCCYLDEGKLRVRWVYDQENITEQKWTVVHAGAPDAIACAICFDSEVVENARGIAEFVTGSENPLIFYVTPEGALICLTLGGAIIEETLAGENVTDVSAVRGPSSKNGGWDLGVTVFFLMGGSLFYRQLINGVWYDAEQVSLGITGETIVKIDAFNTWDYRVGVQCLTQSGKLYQILTYTEGIGVRGTEHIEFNGIVNATATLTGIETHTLFETPEHIEFSSLSATIRNMWKYSVIPQLAQNVNDGQGDWGNKVQITFDYAVHSDDLDLTAFVLSDTEGLLYPCTGYSIAGGEDEILTLEFDDFNLIGRWDDKTATITYTKPESGDLMSPAIPTDSFSISFTATNLNPPSTPQPTYSSASVDSTGMVVTVQFTQPFVNTDLSEVASHFTIGLHEYTYVPNGTLQDTIRSVASVAYGNTQDVLILTLTAPNMSPNVGNASVNYDGLAGLKGLGGPMRSFGGVFTPTGMTWKGNQNDEEHIEVSFSATVSQSTIVRYDAKEEIEHIEFTSVSASAVLTDIHDL